MLSQDSFSVPRVVKSSNTARWAGPLLLVAIVKCARYVSISTAYEFLHGHDFPVMSFLWLIFSIGATSLNIHYTPWKKRRGKADVEWMQIGVYALLLILNFVFLLEGVKLYGPLRTVMTIDYSDLAVAYLAGAMLGRFSVYEDKIKGATVMLVAYMLIFFVDDSSEVDGGVGQDIPAHTLVSPRDADSHSFYLGGFIYVPERFLGGVALSAAIVMTIIRKSMAMRLSINMGAERLFVQGMTMAAVMLSPIALYQWFYSGVYFKNASLGGAAVFSLLFMAICMTHADFAIELFSWRQVSSAHMAKTSIVSSFVFACAYHAYYDHIPSAITFCCFFILLLGMYLFFSEAHARQALSLPLYSHVGSEKPKSPSKPFSTLSFVKLSMRSILSGAESRSIFTFLIINLTFMFVELTYGVWTNSLGLISDSFHMMFDCTALVIGLYASVISRWERNKEFSFGYGGVQVLSGFVNGVFLVFIAIFVLWESLERFMEPPEIRTERLLLVSVLGLLVNLVGMYSFSGAHAHAHGHSHSHSHSHSHAHGDDDDGEVRSFNIDGVFMHVLADTLGSVGVIISSLLVEYLGWNVADPVCSFCISILIFLSVIPLVKDTATILMNRWPAGKEGALNGALRQLRAMDGVIDVSDAHFWVAHSDHLVGTVRLQTEERVNEQSILQSATNLLTQCGCKELTVEVNKEGLGRMGGHGVVVDLDDGDGVARIPLFSPDNPLNPSSNFLLHTLSAAVPRSPVKSSESQNSVYQRRRNVASSGSGMVVVELDTGTNDKDK